MRKLRILLNNDGDITFSDNEAIWGVDLNKRIITVVSTKKKVAAYFPFESIAFFEESQE